MCVQLQGSGWGAGTEELSIKDLAQSLCDGEAPFWQKSGGTISVRSRKYMLETIVHTGDGGA